MKQIWKDLRGYEGFYQISNFGKVKNIHRKSILKGTPNKDGYIVVYLHKHKRGKICLMHRLVFQTFFRRLLPNEQAHHINSVRNDNRANNIVAIDKSKHLSLHHKGKKRTKEDILKMVQTKRLNKLKLQNIQEI